MPVLSEYDLSDKIAILATSGGEEAPQLAAALFEAGASVFTIARNASQLDEILIKTDSVKEDGIVANLATRDGVENAMKAFKNRHDAVDILVNDVRSMFAKPFNETTESEWDEIQFRNLKSTFLLSQQVGDLMITKGYGRIVNIISVLAERGMINGATFSVSQAGVLALTRSLAVEWGRHNIRVNALGVGWFTGQEIPLEVQREELIVRYTPLRRKGVPSDIGPLLVYLASESCDYNTGQPIYIDGGLNAHP
ncbi:MAG: SDR family oxidoreductase [Chloroflexota bacterium]|nr:SDR family oxidoreductase [Chloroflexota bacterium]MEE2880415.1 SDR family oxidoreductase [Chloroflexota bacterium]